MFNYVQMHLLFAIFSLDCYYRPYRNDSIFFDGSIVLNSIFVVFLVYNAVLHHSQRWLPFCKLLALALWLVQCHQKPPHLQKHTQKQNFKDFTIIDRESNTLHHQAKEALHIWIKDPSLNRNIIKVRIPSVFNKLLKPPRQLELPHSSIPHPRGHLLYLVFHHKRQLTLHTSSWSPSTIEMSSLCSHLSNFKTTKPLDLHLQRNT